MKYEECEGCPDITEKDRGSYCQESGTTIADIDECPCEEPIKALNEGGE